MSAWENWWKSEMTSLNELMGLSERIVTASRSPSRVVNQSRFSRLESAALDHYTVLEK